MTMTTTYNKVRPLVIRIAALACIGSAAAACGAGAEGMEGEGEVARQERAVTGCGPVCEKMCYIHLYRCQDKCDTTQSCETACYDKATVCHNACDGDAACNGQCEADLWECSNKCTLSPGCDLACTKAHVKCLKGCACSEECVTDYQCGPGEVCAGVPGNRKCIVPPEI